MKSFLHLRPEGVFFKNKGGNRGPMKKIREEREKGVIF